MVPITEHEITIIEDSVGPRAKDPLPEESAAPEVEVDVPSVALKFLPLLLWMSSHLY